MKVVVFGSTGFVGKALVRMLLEKGFEVNAVGRSKKPKFFSFLPEFSLDYTKCNLLYPRQVEKAVAGTDFIVQLASGSLRESIENPFRDAQTTITGSLNILEACRKHKVKKIVFASTGAVYGSESATRTMRISENTVCKPQTPYAVAKLAVEEYLRVYQQLYGVDYLTLRLFNVYGEGQKSSSGALIPTVLDKIRKNQEIKIYGGGAATRDFIFVDDVCRIIVKGLQNKKIKNRVFNVASGRSASVKEIISLVEKNTGKKARIKNIPARKGEIREIQIDTRKLERVFGLRPASLQKGLELLCKSV